MLVSFCMVHEDCGSFTQFIIFNNEEGVRPVFSPANGALSKNKVLFKCCYFCFVNIGFISLTCSTVDRLFISMYSTLAVIWSFSQHGILSSFGGPTPATDPQEEAPSLLEAEKNGDEASADRLLEKGADPNTTDKDRRPPLHGAAVQGHLPVADLLLVKGADPNKADKD